MGEKKPLGPNQGSDGGGKNFALIRGRVDEIRLRNTQRPNIEVVPVRYQWGVTHEETPW